MKVLSRSYLEAGARDRLTGVLDPGSVQEACGPARRLVSPHLARLDLPQALDDGIMVARGLLGGRVVLAAAQEGRFNGGSVGEIHGAKLVGLLQAACTVRPAAVLLMIDSGGVRLHEANAGILAISEVARALLDVRAQGIPVLALLGGSCGAFGGMGIVTRLCHRVVMSEEARLGLSGPEVIETVQGKEEFDSRDRALVWRVTGGKTRRALGEADRLVDDSIGAFRVAALEWLLALGDKPLPPPDLAGLRARHTALCARHTRFPTARDGHEILAARLGDSGELPALATARSFEQALAVAVGQDSPAPVDPLPPLASVAPEAPEATALDADDARFADRLFGAGHWRLKVAGRFLAGEADRPAGTLWVIGTRDRAPIDAALALRLAAAVLAAVAHDQQTGTPRPLLLLAETQGQALSRHEELLGLHGALAHLALCVDLARRHGHRLLTVVRTEAVSGGFLSFGMLGDHVCALPDAEIRVMDLRAMARVTRIPYEQLQALAQSAPVFAPGAGNFQRLGGVHEVWSDDASWSASLDAALAAAQGEDQRAALGLTRGGRLLAQPVIDEVRTTLEAG